MTYPPVTELVEAIRVSSYVRVGRSLGVSDNAVRKHVIKMKYDPKTLTPLVISDPV